MIVWFLKAIGVPGSFGFLYFSGAICILLLLRKRTRRFGRVTLLVLLGAYLILSVPAVAQSIAGPGTEIGAPLSSLGRFDEVFVIDGDNYLGRASTAVELLAVAKPHTVWYLGGYDLGHALLAKGIPPNVWRRASGLARTTRDQIRWIKQSVNRTQPGRAAVVTSRLQAPRVAALARQEELDIVVVSAPLSNEPPGSGFRYMLPSRAGLALSQDALYERLALIYYRRNGWIS